MNDSTPGEPEDGKPTSFAEKTKNLYRKHREKIHAVGGAVVSAALTVAVTRLAERWDAEDAEDQELFPAPEPTDQPRRALPDPDRDPFLRRLPTGQRASEEARARYRELQREELPDGYTVVRRWLYEAAASALR